VWTNQQITAWREQGQRPIVAVWTAQQLAAFLTTVADDRLYPMWWLIALRGLRRGEAAGLRWCDLDLNAGTITIAQQRIAYGRIVQVTPPKTAASRRTIAVDHATVRLLREHRHLQEAERDAAGDRWQESGYLFTTPDGSPLRPDWLTRRFRRLVTASGLLPTARIPRWAAFWLTEGHDGAALVELAGLHGDDPHEVRDLLPAALTDCGVVVPTADAAAAMEAFTNLARLCIDSKAAERWIVDKVSEILARSGSASDPPRPHQSSAYESFVIDRAAATRDAS
jgi:hypothetical protein